MANGPDFHIKVLIGDLMARLAMAHAEIEVVREEVAALRAKLPPPPEPTP